MAEKRPHIIIFNPDEMRADTLAHLGNPASITPNIDAFSRDDAVSFSNSYCQNPVCVPSRCSFFTGQYPHTNGHRTMANLLKPGEPSLLSELKNSGYYVWMNDRNDLTAGQIPGWTESHASEIYYSGQRKKEPGPIASIRGGQDSKYFYSHYEGELGLDENGRNYSSDDEVVDAAISLIKHPPTEQPLCLFLGLFYPHPPYQVEEPYFSAVDRAKLPARIKSEECSNKSAILDRIRSYQHMDAFSDKDWDELRAVYLGMCMKIDEQFGRLIEALKEQGIYDDCAIFFLSDHGDFAGDYGLPEKCQNSFEDCLTRVPLLVKAPSWIPSAPGVCGSLVELVDFYATALDFAQLPASHTHFGRSLTPLLSDHGKKNRDYVFCEGGRMAGELHCDEYHEWGETGPSPNSVYYPKMKAQLDDHAHEKGIMIRSEKYKYVKRVYGDDEFYDLQKDPGERTNVIDDSSYAPILAQMRSAMLDWLMNTADVVPFKADLRFTPEMTWARVRNLVRPENVDTVKQMIAEGQTLPQIMQFCRKQA